MATSKDPLIDVVESVVIRQHEASKRMDIVIGKTVLIRRMSSDDKCKLAAACCNIISEALASCCPIDDEGECDLSISIMTLFEAMVISLRINEEAFFQALRASTAKKTLLEVTTFLTKNLYPFCDRETHTLNHLTTFMGPILFKQYISQPELVPQTLLDVYHEAQDVQLKAGWSPERGVRRIQYVDIVLSGGGRTVSESQNYYQAIKCPPDFTQLSQVMAHAQEYKSGIYKEIMSLSITEQPVAWKSYQKSLLNSEQDVRDAIQASDGDIDTLTTSLLDQMSVIETCCELCGEESKHRCSRCKEARYCSLACQRQHWSTHRIECVVAVNKK